MTETGKHVLTGAGSGIGLALAHRLAARGDDLVLLARTDARAAELASTFPAAQVLVADLADPGTLARLEGEGRVVFRYAEPAPNGALRDVAGVCSGDGRVVGLMPHPEHAIDALTGPSTDGLGLFTSVLARLTAAA